MKSWKIAATLALLWVFGRNFRGDFSAQSNLAVSVAGLYAQFAALVWIFLFPLLYLIG